MRGLARLISSAISSWAKIGPGMKRKLCRPVPASSSTSEPRMSAGIRSGVNCTRFCARPSTTPRVSASRVLASPGTPTSSAWPPASSVISVSWTTPSWPKMTRPISSLDPSELGDGGLDRRGDVGILVGDERHAVPSRRTGPCLEFETLPLRLVFRQFDFTQRHAHATGDVLAPAPPGSVSRVTGLDVQRPVRPPGPRARSRCRHRRPPAARPGVDRDADGPASRLAVLRRGSRSARPPAGPLACRPAKGTKITL